MSTEIADISMPELGPETPKGSFAAIAAERSIGDIPGVPAGRLHWKGRKVCSVMKVVSALMNAVATAPGGDAPPDELKEATLALLARATALADAAMPLLNIPEESPEFAPTRNALREDAADTISMQWRLSHTTGVRELSVEQITDIYRSVRDSDFLPDVAEEVRRPYAADVVTAKRLALFSAASEINNAVTAFGYFHPDPQKLVNVGVSVVAQLSARGIERILSAGDASPETRAAVTQTFIERAGVLYAQNYRAHANRDIKELHRLDDDERLCRIREHRATGFPTDHIDAAYERLIDRMIDMIVESAPELAGESPEGAPAGEREPIY